MALRQAGIDAHYAYVGGYRLEAKLGHLPFAHALIAKSQNPRTFHRSVREIRNLIDLRQFDIVHSHLTYDHWLALFASRGRKVRLARTFHSLRTLRNDPFTGHLVKRTDHLFVINETFLRARPLGQRTAMFTPPPVDRRQFSPSGENVRRHYGIDKETPVIAAIGKLSPGRGFELLLRSFALLRASVTNARLLVIGHGEHRSELESLAGELEISDRIIWAGYHEDDLAEHYRAADLLLFTAPGSDEGHRAILEAMSCGVPVVSAPIGGVHALLRGLERLIAEDATPAAIAAKAAWELGSPNAALREEVARRAAAFDHPAAAERLIDAYSAARF